MAIEYLQKEIALRRGLPSPEERRRLREAAGLSLEDLGRAVGVSYSTVFNWERGEHFPRRRHLEAYLEALALLREAGGAIGAPRDLDSRRVLES
jgi:transcriptional regulator with XRE-family HTH domain